MSIQITPSVTIFDQTTTHQHEDDMTILKRPANDLIVTPGELISSSCSVMLGHGTYNAPGAVQGEEQMLSSLGGRVVNVNKLVYVLPPVSRYTGKVGDVVIGRITEVAQRRWRVDTNSQLLSSLPLSNVILPGRELRRKSEEDERAMRGYLQQGDVIVAEVRDLQHDGSMVLHMRSQRYSKLGQGCVVKVPSSLVKRQKMHIHSLPCDVTLILGTNGLVWVGASRSASLGFAPDLEPVTVEERDSVCRVRNCVLLLAARETALLGTNVQLAYEASQQYSLRQLLDREVISDIVQIVNAKLLATGTSDL